MVAWGIAEAVVEERDLTRAVVGSAKGRQSSD